MNKTREWTVENVKLENTGDKLSIEDQNSTIFHDSSFYNDYEKKNANTLMNHISYNSGETPVEISNKPKNKYTKLIRDLHKIENEFDRHEIQVSIKGLISAKSTTEKLKFICEEANYLKQVVKNIDSKYENSELNAFKLNLTKTKQSNESKLINLFYHLYKRIFECEAQYKAKMQSFYADIIEEKDYKIDNLEIRLDTAMAHLKRIEEDKLKLK